MKLFRPFFFNHRERKGRGNGKGLEVSDSNHRENGKQVVWGKVEGTMCFCLVEKTSVFGDGSTIVLFLNI